MNNNIPAFPRPEIAMDDSKRMTTFNQSGMTLLDYFAAKAMQGFAADPSNHELFDSKEDVANNAYKLAAAMLKERAKYD